MPTTEKAAGSARWSAARSGVTTTYVYNVLGQLVAEFGGTAEEQPGTRYLTPDHLGSTRVVTADDQSVLSRHDYLPFGEEIGAALGGNRSSVAGYTASRTDGPTQKFTGKERDNESGLDYFGARYFSGAGGRFTSADAPFADQFASDPQSWNLYTYTRNNPLARVDPHGRFVFTLAAIAAALYVVADVVSTGVDAYALYDTVQDPEASAGDILLATGAVGVGLLAPGPGQAYVQGAKQGAKLVSKAAGRVDKAADVAQGTKQVVTKSGKGVKGTEQVARKGGSSNNRKRNPRRAGDRGRGHRMTDKDDPLEQRQEIERAQRRSHQGKSNQQIDSIEKSKQREKKRLKDIAADPGSYYD